MGALPDLSEYREFVNFDAITQSLSPFGLSTRHGRRARLLAWIALDLLFLVLRKLLIAQHHGSLQPIPGSRHHFSRPLNPFTLQVGPSTLPVPDWFPCPSRLLNSYSLHCTGFRDI